MNKMKIQIPIPHYVLEITNRLTKIELLCTDKRDRFVLIVEN